MAVAINQESTTPWSHFKPIWHRSAPPRVVEKYRMDDPLGGWTAWQKHLARRKRPVLPAFHTGKEPALLWGWPLEAGAPGSASASGATGSASAPLDVDWAVAILLEEQAASTAPDVHEAMQFSALAYALPELAQKLPAETWWQLAEHLHDLATEAQQQRLTWPGDPHDVLRQQLLAGELPLALSYLFPEIDPMRGLRKSARLALSEALEVVTDGQGLPHARLLAVLGPLFACWTRVRWMGERLSRGPWSRRADYQYQWLVRHAIRLADKGGRFVLTPSGHCNGTGEASGTQGTGGASGSRSAASSTRTFAGGTCSAASCWSRPLLSMALDLAGDNGDCAAATAALSARVVPKHIQFDADDLPDASLNSDWSGISVLSNGWSPSAIRLAVSYADDPVHIELAAGGERIFAGPWTLETTCDGVPVRVAGEWEELCWQSDKNSDFLELGVKLTEGLRLERQLLLGKKDRVLYLADIVVSRDGDSRRLHHAMHLPLDAAAQWQGEPKTRDGRLLGRTLRAAVMPLALPEWRTDPRGGELAEHDGRLVLTQESHGRAICCPLFFDLKPGRAMKDRTWRQLTVAEWMEVVPRDVAVGFRAQSGRGQWLVYRSLGPVGNRTVLGQNIAGEFCAGRFQATGEFDDWLEIEAM